MKTKQSKGGCGGNFSKSNSDARTANKRRREKYAREEERYEEEMAAQHAYEQAVYWQPVDKKDRKHRQKMFEQQQKAYEAELKKADK